MGKWKPWFMPLVDQRTGTLASLTLMDCDGDRETADRRMSRLEAECVGQPIEKFTAEMHLLDEEAERAHMKRVSTDREARPWRGL